MSHAIEVRGLSKLYRRAAPGFRMRTLKSALLEGSLTHGLSKEESIHALQEISFSVKQGEAFGVVGSNGSGKSTLLKLVAGILTPTSGSLVVDGRVAALIELGAGFHPEISGRENIFINGAVLGLSRRETERRYEAIVEFSGLADFIEEPVKNYSSGMYVRLGFSVAIHTDPDVLLVDEVLAVGDEAFAHRCLRRIEEFLSRGNTLLLVSHSLPLIEKYSSRVLWLEDGQQRMIGDPRYVVDTYRQAVAEEEGRIHREEKEELEREVSEAPGEDAAAHDEAASTEREAVEEPRRWGSGEARIQETRLRDSGGLERYHFRSGETVVIEMDVDASRGLTDFVFGVGIFTPRGVECWGTNTDLEDFVGASFVGSGTVRVVCPGLRLAPGEYLLNVAVHARDGTPYDYWKRVVAFSVTAARQGAGVYFPEHEWEFSGGIEWSSRPGDSPSDD